MRILEGYLVRRAMMAVRWWLGAAWIVLLGWMPAHGATVTLAWDPSPSPNLTGYLVHYGSVKGNYSQQRLVSTNNCLATIDNLAVGQTYFFVVTARGAQGVESLPSNEVSKNLPTTPPPSTSPLTVLEEGDGNVTPNLHGQELLVGHTYRLVAHPGAGSIFVGWTGGVTSSAPSLRFVMTSNLVLTAKFMTNPFPPLAGTYNGLFYEAADVRAGRSGFIAVTATGQGAYSGKVMLGNRTHGFSGRLDVGGKATNVISRPHTNALTVELDFNDGGLADRVTGRVTDGAWAALLLGDRAGFDTRMNPAPFAGSYTLIVPGTNNPAAGPQGDGFATVTVDTRGGVRLVGALADGSKVSQRVFLSQGGVWPLYLPLYHGQGSVLGWQTISNLSNADITGLLSWIRPTQPASKYWPAGFTNDTAAIGSAYTAPGLTNWVLPPIQYDLTFAGGELGAGLTQGISLGAHNKIVVQDADELSMTITLKSGLFAGKVVDPLSGKRLSFKGAILQKQSGGAGFLLGTNRSARVAFGF